MKKTGLFTFLLIIAVSCLNEPDCYQLNNDTVAIDFRIIGGGVDNVFLTGIQSPASDVSFARDTVVQKIPLPLTPKAEETLYTISTAQGDNFLNFGYKRQVQFVSTECGERYYYQELNVLEHDYDSVRVVNTIPVPSLSAATSKNVEVYRCAITNLMVVNFNAETLVEGITSDAGVILSTPTTLKEFVLPLRTSDTTTTYKFDLGANVKTLRVKYSRTKKTFADICGEQTLLSDLHINKLVTDLTLVTIVKDSIQDVPVRNLDITP
jgi:hypothetical protein